MSFATPYSAFSELLDTVGFDSNAGFDKHGVGRTPPATEEYPTPPESPVEIGAGRFAYFLAHNDSHMSSSSFTRQTPTRRQLNIGRV